MTHERTRTIAAAVAGLAGMGALDILARDGALPTPPEPPAPKTGRRETRAEINRGVQLLSSTERTAEGATMPITRKEPKRPAGMTAKAWKRQRRLDREAAERQP